MWCKRKVLFDLNFLIRLCVCVCAVGSNIEEKTVPECRAQTKTLQNESTKELIGKGKDFVCQLVSPCALSTLYSTWKSEKERVCQ